MQNRPKLFSTFMLQLLAELYAVLPEAAIWISQNWYYLLTRHTWFSEATSALLQQIETIIKLIRSKGVGIFFCTQNPQDVPASVLSQLGLKVQHALRAFTAADRKTIKQAAENYPETAYYRVNELITELGIGEALITMLNEKGIPTPLVHTLLTSPRSRMDVLTDTEINTLTQQSKLVKKYAQSVDNESAYEILSAKLAEAEKNRRKNTSKTSKPEPTVIEKVLDNPVSRQVQRTAATIITGSLLGALGLGGRSSSKKKTSWF